MIAAWRTISPCRADDIGRSSGDSAKDWHRKCGRFSPVHACPLSGSETQAIELNVQANGAWHLERYQMPPDVTKYLKSLEAGTGIEPVFTDLQSAA